MSAILNRSILQDDNTNYNKEEKEMIENMEYGVPIINSKNKFWFS
jgi:hypothetical protein